MSPIKAILLGLICLLAGCARIIIQLGSDHRVDTDVTAGTTDVGVKREKEKQ